VTKAQESAEAINSIQFGSSIPMERYNSI